VPRSAGREHSSWQCAVCGLHVLHHELLHKQISHDLDRLHLLIDVAELGISGYQAADWYERTGPRI
jgi:hypothetical protein